MQSAFWTNTIWYILLGISTIAEITFVIAKTKNRKLLLALFFTISGITFSIEAVLFFFKAYNYYPMILPQLPLDDMIAGNLFSQFSITASLLLIVFLGMRHYWYFIFAGIYCAIEEFFILKGVFSHNWYQTWITFVGFVFLCWLTKRIYLSCLNRLRSVHLYIYMLFSFFTLYLITLLWVFKLAGIINFSTKVFDDPLRSYASLAIFNMLIITVPCIFIYFSKLKWPWKTAIIMGLYVIKYIQCKMNLMSIKQGWFFLYISVEIIGTLLYVFALHRLYDNKEGMGNNK